MMTSNNTAPKAVSQQGFALLLSIIVASVVLAIGVSILRVSVSQLQLSVTGRESEVSFQAAQSMTECLQYWRYQSYERFEARPPSGTVGAFLEAPNITCEGQSPYLSHAEILAASSNINVVKFHYTFNTVRRCSSADMYVISPLDASAEQYDLDNTSAGIAGDGVVSCPSGNSCTVLVAQGYNRPCDELENSSFTVQREITTEF